MSPILYDSIRFYAILWDSMGFYAIFFTQQITVKRLSVRPMQGGSTDSSPCIFHFLTSDGHKKQRKWKYWDRPDLTSKKDFFNRKIIFFFQKSPNKKNIILNQKNIFFSKIFK